MPLGTAQRVYTGFTPSPYKAYGGVVTLSGHGLKRRLMLHDLCAGARGELGFAGSMWSACQGSLGLGGSWQIQQMVACWRTCLALCL
jgi:hypothetical protein